MDCRYAYCRQNTAGVCECGAYLLPNPEPGDTSSPTVYRVPSPERIEGVTMQRIQRHQLPDTATACPRAGCVYNEDGVCDQPSINKGNGDAACHRMTNRQLLVELRGDAALAAALK